MVQDERTADALSWTMKWTALSRPLSQELDEAARRRMVKRLYIPLPG